MISAMMGMLGEWFRVGWGVGMCLLLKIPWIWSPFFFNFLYNYNIALTLSYFGSCLILYNTLKFLSHGNLCSSFGLLWLCLSYSLLSVFSASFLIGPQAFSVLPLPRFLITPFFASWGTHCFETVNFSYWLHEHLCYLYCRHVSIVGWGRDWWLSLYVFLPSPVPNTGQ